MRAHRARARIWLFRIFWIFSLRYSAYSVYSDYPQPDVTTVTLRNEKMLVVHVYRSGFLNEFGSIIFCPFFPFKDFFLNYNTISTLKKDGNRDVEVLQLYITLIESLPSNEVSSTSPVIVRITSPLLNVAIRSCLSNLIIRSLMPSES